MQHRHRLHVHLWVLLLGLFVLLGWTPSASAEPVTVTVEWEGRRRKIELSERTDLARELLERARLDGPAPAAAPAAAPAPIPEPPSPDQPQAPPTPDPTRLEVWGGTLLNVGAPLLALLIMLGTVVYNYIIVPRGRRRPLVKAMGLLESDDKEADDDLERVETLLDEALTNGMHREDDIADARFAMAYVHAQRENLDGVATALRELSRARPHDESESADEVFFRLWLAAQRGEHDEVARIYEDHELLMKTREQARLAVGVAYLKRANRYLEDKEFKLALDYYGRLRGLEVLTEHIPSQTDELQVLFGVRALFTGDITGAKAFFEGAREADARAFRPRLGLAMCRWVTEVTPDLCDEITALVTEMRESATHFDVPPRGCQCPECGIRYEVPVGYDGRELECRGCRAIFDVQSEPIELPVADRAEEFQDDEATLTGEDAAVAIDSADLNDAVDDEFEEDEDTEEVEVGGEPIQKVYTAAGLLGIAEERPERLLDEDDLLLRNAMLWRATTLLHRWLSRESDQPPTEEDLEEFTKLVGQVLEVDPGFSDPRVLEGLILYFLSHEDVRSRRTAVGLLDEATNRDVSLPEVLSLRDREQRIAELQGKSVDRFRAALWAYMTDSEIRPEDKAYVEARLGELVRFPTVEGLEEPPENLPSLGPPVERAKVLRKRIESALRRSHADRARAEEILGQKLANFAKSQEALAAQTEHYVHEERELLSVTGELILPDEEAIEEADPALEGFHAPTSRS